MSLPTRVARGFVDPFENITREFDVLNRIFNSGQSNGARLAPYGVDIREDGDTLVVEAELPGFRKEEVDITLENQTLTISAEKKEERRDEKKGDYLLNERRYSRFLRSFTLPPTVDEKTVNARLEDGVLTVSLNKREETKPRKIAVG
ncbi:Hsp20/alpha crystallin family protein [Humisphaera borealis]|uniref:Hsp20/alpha crystallin family protein n=1 Tax=Humisphaera borealis TaxID=2807512 RepID=A0A7M2WS15_9BACT|nr:Hsp20/alpha crystallin family protein [Humisphaera borealis]QOV88233.1 Hsp20/alpha crystallin family protein [Humisphaera borealis]